MGLLDHMNIFGDVATCHRGDKKVFANLFLEIQQAGAIPKIQLFSEQTFPRQWVEILPPEGFVPSVFRPGDVDFIVPYKPLAIKVASVEATYWELIERCLQEDLPLIVSTGGMDEGELTELLDLFAARRKTQELCLMHCVSLYPTPSEKLNLGRLAALSGDVEEDPNIVVGWSSHYPAVDIAAFALAWAWGATQFEVHVRPARPCFEQTYWGPRMEKVGETIKILPDGPIVVKEPFEELTLDEQCAFTPAGLKQIRSILEDLPVLEGSDDYVGPDRPAVLEWRKRWQGE